MYSPGNNGNNGKPIFMFNHLYNLVHEKCCNRVCSDDVTTSDMTYD